MNGFYWNFTSCIRSENRTEITSAIVNLVEQEIGYSRLSQLPYLVVNMKKIRHIPMWERPPLLIIGLGVGREGWTIIKTYPNDWLFLRIPSRERPRLSKLAMQLKCDAFHYRVIRDEESLLLEANSRGDFQFNSTNNPQFSLIEVSESLHRAMQVNQDPEIVRKKAEYHAEWNRQKADGKMNVQLLASLLDELKEGDAERIDTALAKILDYYQYYWQNYDLFNQAYANFQQLEKMNVQLLYFQPPDNYLRTLPNYYKEPEEYWYEEEL